MVPPNFFKKRKSSLSLYCYEPGHNFGDILNLPLIEMLSAAEISIGGVDTVEMIAIGSILDRLITGSVPARHSNIVRTQQNNADQKHPIHVWGTGLMYRYDDLSAMRFIRPTIIHALRGELTRQTIERMTGRRISCPVADPGLLAPLLLQKKSEKQFSLGIIPHVKEFGLPAFHSVHTQVDDSIIIDMTADPLEILQQISSCESILSTGLHGLIVADAFGIPNRWCKLTDVILGNGFKFQDYYSGYGLKGEAYDLNDGTFPAVYDIKNNYAIDHEMVLQKQRRLLECFPYRVIDLPGKMDAVQRITRKA